MSSYAELDSRKRISLAKIATSNSYIVTAEANGRIVLDPAVVMTKTEAALMGDSDLQQQVAASLADPGPLHDRPARHE